MKKKPATMTARTAVKIMSCLLTAVVIVGGVNLSPLGTVEAKAATTTGKTYDLRNGRIFISNNDEGNVRVMQNDGDTNNLLHDEVLTPSEQPIVLTSGGDVTKNKVSISESASRQLTVVFDKLMINTAGATYLGSKEACGVNGLSSGTVTIKLKGKNSLISSGSNNSGLFDTYGGSLEITSIDGDGDIAGGSLMIQGSGCVPGIHGFMDTGELSRITFKGGDIKVCGGNENTYGAPSGIGSIKGVTSDISIKGGRVEAWSNAGGYAIGSYYTTQNSALYYYIPENSYAIIKDGESTYTKYRSDSSEPDGRMDIPITYDRLSIEIVPAPTPTTPQTPSEDKNDQTPTDNSAKKSEDTFVNPLSWYYTADPYGSLCLMSKQGPVCTTLFQLATPKGFKEAFSFNLLLRKNGIFQPTYDKKAGKFVINIPKEYQKAGRTFALIGIDKFGNTKIFYDADLSDETFTTMLDMEGYAFSLVYLDKTKSAD